MIQDGGHLREDSGRMAWEQPHNWVEVIVRVLAFLLGSGFMGAYCAVKVY